MHVPTFAMPLGMVLALLCSTADARQPVRSIIKPEPDIQAVPAAKAEPPVKAKAPAKPVKRPPRRPVLQMIDPVRPIHNAAPPPPTFGLPSAATPLRPPGPQQIVCDAAGCTDMHGARYNSGVGKALIDSQGRSCTRLGNTAQCF
jgi:hypothetical protein